MFMLADLIEAGIGVGTHTHTAAVVRAVTGAVLAVRTVSAEPRWRGYAFVEREKAHHDVTALCRPLRCPAPAVTPGRDAGPVSAGDHRRSARRADPRRPRRLPAGRAAAANPCGAGVLAHLSRPAG
jgi:hypothetical protein